MFKKWFIRCTAALALVIGVLSVTLAYQFTQNDTGVSSPGESSLTVEAAAPPRESSIVELKPAVAVKGQSVDPYDFLSDATPSDVVAFFNGEVNTNSPGVNDIVLTLNNGLVREEATVTLYILETAAVTVEAGTQDTIPNALDFVGNENILPPGTSLEVELLTGLSDLASYEVGNYNVEILINGVKVSSALQVVDTTPPSATSVGFTVNLGEPVTPERFVTDVVDVSPVTVTYVADYEPDVFLSGEHLVTVLVEDSYGNSAKLNAMLKVLPNTNPPRFVGLKDLEAFLGDPVMYRMGVTAEDSFGNELEFEVDSAAVDIAAPGSYPVKYSATDGSGNYIEEEVLITVVNISEEAIEESLNSVMAQIITEDMTQTEKAKAVFEWIRTHISYVSDSPKNSVYEGAYRALTQGNGDCFTFYSIAEVMLTAAGIPNQRVTRIEGTPSAHYWNLINADDTGWYHFDSTPVAVHSIDRFMFTDGEAASYTETIRRQTGSRDYYTYDKSLHPEAVQ